MKPVILIYGEDEFQVSTKTHQLIDQLISPDEKTMGLEMIDGKTENSSEAIKILRQCLEAIQTIGFLNGRKVVWLSGATFFDQGIVARSKDVQEAVSALTAFITSGIPTGHLTSFPPSASKTAAHARSRWQKRSEYREDTS